MKSSSRSLIFVITASMILQAPLAAFADGSPEQIAEAIRQDKEQRYTPPQRQVIESKQVVEIQYEEQPYEAVREDDCVYDGSGSFFERRRATHRYRACRMGRWVKKRVEHITWPVRKLGSLIAKPFKRKPASVEPARYEYQHTYVPPQIRQEERKVVVTGGLRQGGSAKDVVPVEPFYPQKQQRQVQAPQQRQVQVQQRHQQQKVTVREVQDGVLEPLRMLHFLAVDPQRNGSMEVFRDPNTESEGGWIQVKRQGPYGLIVYTMQRDHDGNDVKLMKTVDGHVAAYSDDEEEEISDALDDRLDEMNDYDDRMKSIEEARMDAAS